MDPVESYLKYIAEVKRYSPRTVSIYSCALGEFAEFTDSKGNGSALVKAISNSTTLRRFEVFLLDDRKLGSRTVNLYISALGGFCKYLMKAGELSSNPLRTLSRPKQEKRLPQFYRPDSMNEYFARTQVYASSETCSAMLYPRILGRIVISVLFGTGIRRSELIGLSLKDFDSSRKVLHILGKGDKRREVPLTDNLCSELVVYREKVLSLGIGDSSPESPLLVSKSGGRLYPVLVDRMVKQELGDIPGISARKSPHVLRHTIATELLDNGADINSIKQLLGHSSLAATQVYTHNSIEKLKSVYAKAHPRSGKKD